MAFEEALKTISREASGDLSGNQYHGVKVDSNGQIAVAGEGDAGVGILQDKPAAAGRAGCVAIGGVSKAHLGGTVTKGQRVATNSAGKFVAVGSGDDWSIGVCLVGGAADEIGSVLIQPTGPTV